MKLGGARQGPRPVGGVGSICSCPTLLSGFRRREVQSKGEAGLDYICTQQFLLVCFLRKRPGQDVSGRERRDSRVLCSRPASSGARQSQSQLHRTHDKKLHRPGIDVAFYGFLDRNSGWKRTLWNGTERHDSSWDSHNGLLLP